MNEQKARRIQKLMKINMKAENPPDLIARLADDSITLDTRITGKSDKEVIDTLISKDEQDYKSIGVMYHVLTSVENTELFTKMLKYINGGGVDYWHTVLCNMNMILFECWPFIHLTCKEQLLRLIREAVRLNVKQIENVLMNAYRVANVSADPAGKQRIFLRLTQMIRENESWFRGQKQCAALVASILTCTTSVIASSPAPMTAQDTFREQLIDLVHFVIKSKKTDCQTLGRDFILVLMRLGKLPQVEDIWKDIVTNPASYGVTGIEDFLSKPNVLQHLRLSIELDRKLQFMVNNGGKNMLIYFSWFSNKYLRGADGPAMRAECVRQLLYMVLDPSKPSCFENRIQIIHLLVTTTQPVPEQQWLKLCLFADWFGCDEKNLTNFNYVEVPFLVLRYALFLPPMSSHVNTIVQNSHGVQYANSLLEYICKSVDVLIPQLSSYVRKNVNNAMRCCRDRLPHIFPQVMENTKIDRKVMDLLKTVFPEFVRNAGGVALPIRPKKKPTEETKQPRPSTSTPPEILDKTEKLEKPEKLFENQVEKTSLVEKSSCLKVPAADLEKYRKEQEEKEEKELNSAIKLLRGEIGAKMVSLKEEWKNYDEDADKCEAVEDLIQLMLNTEENFDDAQQELAAQCLQGIMGSVVVVDDDEKSLLPENEKDLSEAFTHPVYSFLKFLCSPPDDDDATNDMLTTMMAAMREKDSSLTYVLLYFIKGTLATRAKEVIESYRDIAKMSGRGVDEMLASDMQLCAVNDIRLFGYLAPFVFTHFENEVTSTPEILCTLCANLDAMQLRTFVSDIMREEIKIFKKETFSKMIIESVDWATTPQWIFWHLIHADGVPIEWFLSSIPKLDIKVHHEAIANILLMMKRMDREPWAGLIRALFSRAPSRDDTFSADALKVLIEDTDQCHKIAEIVGQLIKKLIGNNDLLGIGVRAHKKGSPLKLTLQQVLEHLQHFSVTCVEKKQRSAEAFMARSHMQEAFASIKVNDKTVVLQKKYANLFNAMEIIAQDTKEQSSSRTLRGNRQGSAGDKQSKRKTGDGDDEQSNKKRKLQKDLVELSDSDSD